MSDSKPLTPDELRAALLADAKAEAQRVTKSEHGTTCLTVAETAALLGKNEKTIRRMIARGELKAHKVTTASGPAWRIESPDNSPDGGQVRVDTARTSSDIVHEETGQPAGALGQEVSAHLSTVPSLTTDMPGQDTSGPDAMTMRLIETQAGEIAHLRAQVEAQATAHRTQIEQHQRAEAELRAALREALKMSAKALPAPDPATGEGAAATGQQIRPQDAQQRDEKPVTTFVSPEPQSEAQAVTEATPAPWYPERRDGLLHRAKIWLFGG